ncbi:MAG: hypothetical protein AB1598_01440 [Thermodesulfobacteriota bacterium]
MKLTVNSTNLFDKTSVARTAAYCCSYGSKLNVLGTLSYNW